MSNHKLLFLFEQMQSIFAARFHQLETGDGCYKHLYTALSWFSFSSLEILLFSVYIINVSAAKSGTVLDNLSMNIYIYIYIFFFFIFYFLFIYFFKSSGPGSSKLG